MSKIQPDGASVFSREIADGAHVENLAGVSSAQTDMTAHTVTVEFDDETTDIDAIVKALSASGFDVSKHQPVSD